MRFFTNDKKSLLIDRNIPVQTCHFENPGRGWYRIYTYKLGGDEEILHPASYENETIALLLFDIGAFKDRELDGTSLAFIDNILNEFALHKMDVIVRVTYDTEGMAQKKEPESFSLVKKHMAQICGVLVLHQDIIVVYQGLLVGNWGEMHGSKYLSDKHLKELTAIFQSKTKGRIPLAFRKPQHYRMVAGKGKLSKVGFFNDAMLASHTCMGTYGEKSKQNAAWNECWLPEDEIAYMQPMLKTVPLGGEAVWAGRMVGARETIRFLRQHQVTYLNSVYDEQRLQQWKDTNFEEGNLYQYISERLGYLLVLRRCLVEKGKDLLVVKLDIENQGFARIYDQVDLQFWVDEMQRDDMAGKSFGEQRILESRLKHGNVMNIEAGKTEQLLFEVKLNWECTGRGLYVQMIRHKDGRNIHFGNEGDGDKVYLGNL